MNRKQIRVTITLAGKDETFTSNGENQLSATGLRVLCDIAFGYGAVMPTAQIRIYGLALEKMMKLFRVRWNTMNEMMNRIKIEAGEQGEKLITEFEGNITFAYPDFSNAPDVALVIDSQTAIIDNLKPAKPLSYEGAVDVANVIQDICDDMGYQLENNGFSAMAAPGLVLNGPNIGKLRQLSADYSFDLYIENNLVAITTKGGSRNIQIPVITPTTGLVGYPIPDIKGVSFKCMYDPLLRFGGVCKIRDSMIDVCNGDWRIYGLHKTLEANQPNGSWFCEVSATWRDSTDAAISTR